MAYAVLMYSDAYDLNAFNTAVGPFKDKRSAMGWAKNDRLELFKEFCEMDGPAAKKELKAFESEDRVWVENGAMWVVVKMSKPRN